MTKLIIQIPCLNEAQTLGVCLEQIPRAYDGIDEVEFLVVDDGSTDETVAVAKRYGVEHVVSLGSNKGLASAFMAGVEHALRAGADIIVNTDADNQYCGADIQKLIDPVLGKQAEIVMGERLNLDDHNRPFLHNMLHQMSCYMVQKTSRFSTLDVSCSFRAISRQAAMKINVFHIYTLEMILQAARQDISIVSVSVRTQVELRPSRLVKRFSFYVRQMMFTMFHVMNAYQPFYLFFVLGSILVSLGIILGIKWSSLFFLEPALYVPRIILVASFILIGIQLAVFGWLSNFSSVNRKLMEDIQFRLRQGVSGEKID